MGKHRLWWIGLGLLGLVACGKATSNGDDVASDGSLANSGGRGLAGDRPSDGNGGRTSSSSGGRATGGEGTLMGGQGPTTGGAAAGGTEPGTDGGAPSSSIWYFVQDDSDARVVNIQNPEAKIPILSWTDPEHGDVPWSSDGTKLAQLVGEEIVYYSLDEEGKVSARLPAPNYVEVVGWVQGVGPVVTGARNERPILAVVPPNDSEILLVEAEANSDIYFASASPDGREVLWSVLNGDAYELWHLPFHDGKPGQAERLASYAGSPALGAAWSSHGYFGFGISGGADEGGIYLWRAPGVPTRVSPRGANYGPFFGFSPDSSKFAMFLSGAETTGIYGVGTSPDGLTEVYPIAEGAEISPYYWTPFNQLVYLGKTGAIWQDFNADASLGETSPLGIEAYGCQVLWISPKEYVFTRCTSGSGVTIGSIQIGATVLREVASEGLDNIALSADRSCFLEWDNTTARVASAEFYVNFSPLNLDTQGATIVRAEFAPDSSSVVWASDSGAVYRSDLANCMPVGKPAAVLEALGQIDATAFLPHTSK